MSALVPSVILGEELLDRPYVYPMSNATNGGEAHTEYNVRSALSNLVSYSAAFSEEDFSVSNFGYMNDGESNKISLSISRGKGNCNSYFVSLDSFGSPSSPKTFAFDPNAHIPANMSVDTHEFRFGLYLSVVYNQNIADGLCYRFICDGYKNIGEAKFNKNNTEYSNIYEQSYKNQGFNDIGIYLGWSIYNKNGFSQFVTNPDKTRCIDISRLGDESTLTEKLSELITRLQVLNIYGGNFYISNSMINGEDAGSDGIIEELGADFRLRLHVSVDDVTDSTQFPWLDCEYYILTDSTKLNINDNNTIFTRSVYRNSSGNLNSWGSPLYTVYRRVLGQSYVSRGSDMTYRFTNDIINMPKSEIVNSYKYINIGLNGIRGVYRYNSAVDGWQYLDSYEFAGSHKDLYFVKDINASTGKYTNISGSSVSLNSNYIYTCVKDSYTYIVYYSSNKWEEYKFKILSNPDNILSELSSNDIGVLFGNKYNTYYKYDGSNLIAETKYVTKNNPSESYPAPISKKYFYDGSTRLTSPTGLKQINGTISLVRTNLGGQDTVIFDIVSFLTEPFITPYTGYSELSYDELIDKRIELDSNNIHFIQDINVGTINANIVNANDVNSVRVTIGDSYKSILTSELDGQDSNKSLLKLEDNFKANKVYGAVWM